VFKFGICFRGGRWAGWWKVHCLRIETKKRCLRGIVGWSTRVGVWLSMKMIND
jgi:hypothetical protein